MSYHRDYLKKKSKTTSINELIINHNKITGDKNIANEFNNFFCEIGPQLAENIPPSDFDPLRYVILQQTLSNLRILREQN